VPALIGDRERLAGMTAALRSVGRTDAASSLAAHALERIAEENR
jgi:hypothetical protein